MAWNKHRSEEKNRYLSNAGIISRANRMHQKEKEKEEIHVTLAPVNSPSLTRVINSAPARIKEEGMQMLLLAQLSLSNAPLMQSVNHADLFSFFFLCQPGLTHELKEKGVQIRLCAKRHH